MAVKYAVCSIGCKLAFRSVSIRRFVSMDDIEYTPVLFRSSVLDSLVRCTGDFIARLIILVWAASIRCSCVRLRTCASSAYVSIACTMVVYICILAYRYFVALPYFVESVHCHLSLVDSVGGFVVHFGVWRNVGSQVFA